MAAEDHLAAEQFGFKPWDPKISEEIVGSGVHPWGEGELKTISLARGIRASQSTLDPAAVEHYTQHPNRPYRGGWQPKPTVAEHGGELVVLTGHHRIAGAIRRGQSKMRVGYQRSGE